MQSMYLKDILSVIGGQIVRGNGDLLICNVVTNPRYIRDHVLYLHMYKKYNDFELLYGNEKQVIVTTQPELFLEQNQSMVIVLVKDIKKAFWTFTNYYRGLFKIPVIAVTGTCGKTTTKEMIKHLLKSEFHHVQATYRSNNSSHLAFSYLLGLDKKTQAAVYEVGVSYPKGLAYDCKILRPQIRLLLNIGVNHLVGCKTPEIYAKAKSEILEGLDKEKGILILNADDVNIAKMDVSPYKNVIYFGFSKYAHFKLTSFCYVNKGMYFHFIHNHQKYIVSVPGLGKHTVYNALASIIACYCVGIELNKSIERLASFTNLEEHLQLRNGPYNCTIIDDTWNSSPLSMSASLDVLAERFSNYKKIAILGHIPQLGNNEYTTDLYKRLGRKVIETGVDVLFVVGEMAKQIGWEALEFGMNPSQVHFCSNGINLLRLLYPMLNQTTVVLVKLTHQEMKEPSYMEFKKVFQMLHGCGK